MSAIEFLSIALEHDIDEQYQYQPGEVVRGKICIKANRPSFIRTIYITIVGEGNVGWDDEKTQETYTAQETYINASKMIVDARDTRPKGIHVGNNFFSFEYQLPENLPSSYIGKYGSVTYLLKATVSGDKAIDQAITSEPFLCLRRCPLPAIVETPIEMSKDKMFFPLFCCSNISLTAGINKRGAVPGEDLFVHSEVNNNSTKHIRGMQASIIMHSVYHAKKKSTFFRQIVNKKRDDYELNPGEGRRWSHARLTVPPYIPESKLEYCDIIDLSYIFQFRVELAGGDEIRVETPLIIGAQPHGLEVPQGSHGNNNINQTWTVKMKGVVLNNGIDYNVRDTVHDWHGGVPPELRSNDKSVINNPLFRNHSFKTQGAGQQRQNKALDELPEIIENTKL